MAIRFTVHNRDVSSAARLGELTTKHGTLPTPVFMPVGTYGTVRGITAEALQALGCRILLANAYHLAMRPGKDFFNKIGGLHKFMGWPGAILTDSGGFQLFSLTSLTKVSEAGVDCQSHIDGSRHLITPESVVEMQAAIGSDIAMPLDSLIALPAPRREVEQSVRQTLRWLKRAEIHKRNFDLDMFAIIQGGTDLELRRLSLGESLPLDFAGVALGGFSVGEPKPLIWQTLAAIEPMLPADKPRYLMGMGSPEDLVDGVALGIDMFDCVLPTRNARNGLLFTSRGNIVIKNAKYALDEAAIDPECACFVCQRYSRAYIRYLFKTEELLGLMLNTHHNVHYYINLMGAIRQAISAGQFDSWRREFHRQRSENCETDNSIMDSSQLD